MNRYEQLRLKSLVNLYVNSIKNVNKKGSETVLVKMTAGDVRAGDGSHLSKNSLMFMKSIRGTSAYWKDELHTLLARFKCLGPPTLFLTQSLDDAGCEELQNLLKYDLGNAYVNPHEAVRKDPVMVALFADKWFHKLLNMIRTEKPFGTVTDYYVRKEWQNRGTVHFHYFLWIEDAPSLEKGSSEEEIVAFIDKCVSTQLADPETDPEFFNLVKERQTHNHAHTCKLGSGQRDCRFFFPRRVCEKARLLPACDRRFGKQQFYKTVL